MSSKSKKLLVALVLAICLSAVMLSSCTVYYAGTYKTEFGGIESTLKLKHFGDAEFTNTIGGVTTKTECKYKVKDKTITIYDKDGKESGKYIIKDRNTLKIDSDLVNIEYKREGVF